MRIISPSDSFCEESDSYFGCEGRVLGSLGEFTYRSDNTTIIGGILLEFERRTKFLNWPISRFCMEDRSDSIYQRSIYYIL